MNQLLDILPLPTSSLSLSQLLLFFMLIFTRWLALSLFLPWLGAQLLPGPVRVALAAVLSLLCASFLLPNINIPADLNIFIISLLILKEAIIGILLAFLASLIFYSYELAGELIDLARGASMAKLLVPHVKHQSSPMGALLFQFSLVIFLALGLHRPVISVLVHSFERFPIFELSLKLDHDSFLALAVSVLADLLELAFRLSLPIIFICFLIDVAFGFLNRAAPQINAYFLSLPAKIIAGLAMLWLVLGFLIDDFLSHTKELDYLFKILNI